jgi:hypothetical protein
MKTPTPGALGLGRASHIIAIGAVVLTACGTDRALDPETDFSSFAWPELDLASRPEGIPAAYEVRMRKLPGSRAGIAGRRFQHPAIPDLASGHASQVAFTA